MTFLHSLVSPTPLFRRPRLLFFFVVLSMVFFFVISNSKVFFFIIFVISNSKVFFFIFRDEFFREGANVEALVPAAIPTAFYNRFALAFVTVEDTALRDVALTIVVGIRTESTFLAPVFIIVIGRAIKLATAASP
jgi:hypothetical protein